MCCFRWCGRQLCLHNRPISGVNSTPRPTAVYASDPALPRRPQDSLPSCLLGFGRTRLSLASSFQLSYRTPHPALGQDFTPRVAACTLALSPICDTLIEGFSHFVTSMTAPIASGWSGCRMGFAPTGKRRLWTAHTRNGHAAAPLVSIARALVPPPWFIAAIGAVAISSHRSNREPAD